MVQITPREGQIAAAAVGVVLAAGAVWWLFRQHRPTADEIERERRQIIFSYGRIVDGTLLDRFQITTNDGDGSEMQRDMLLYQYEISGVVYECSQDVTALASILDPSTVKLGYPCSIRYQPGSPENSIVIAERWSGIREVYASPRIPHV